MDVLRKIVFIEERGEGLMCSDLRMKLVNVGYGDNYYLKV